MSNFLYSKGLSHFYFGIFFTFKTLNIFIIPNASLSLRTHFLYPMDTENNFSIVGIIFLVFSFLLIVILRARLLAIIEYEYSQSTKMIKPEKLFQR